MQPANPIKRGPGRPRLAAQSLQEALSALEAGKVPSRPRNSFEREVFGKTKGRRRQPESVTSRAAELAVYLLSEHPLAALEKERDIQISKAVKTACTILNLPLTAHRSNVRRYVKKRLSPTVTVNYSGQSFFGSGLMGTLELPLVVSVDDWKPE